MLLEPLVDAEAVAARHVDIEQKEVRRILQGELDGLVAVLDADDPVALLLEETAHVTAERLIVLGHENRLFRHAGFPSDV